MAANCTHGIHSKTNRMDFFDALTVATALLLVYINWLNRNNNNNANTQAS